jgi:hypothetical protein
VPLTVADTHVVEGFNEPELRNLIESASPRSPDR